MSVIGGYHLNGLHSNIGTNWPALVCCRLLSHHLLTWVRPRLYHSGCGLIGIVGLQIGQKLSAVWVDRLVLIVTTRSCFIWFTIWLLHLTLDVRLRVQPLVHAHLMLTTGMARKCRLPSLGRDLVLLKEPFSYFLGIYASSCENTCVRVNHNIVG